MRLSIAMLVREMATFSPEAHIETGGRVLRNARLLPESQELSRTTLYLQQNTPHTVLCMNLHDTIVVHADDVDEVLNMALDIFDRYNEWSARVDDAIQEGCELERVLALAAREAGLHFIVADATYLIYAHAGDGTRLEDPRIGEVLAERSMSLDAIMRIDANPLVRSLDARTYYVALPEYGQSSVVANLVVDGRHQGWLVGFRNSDTYGQADLDFADAVAAKVELWMQRSRPREARREQTGIFVRLLCGEEIEGAELDRTFDTFSWRSGDVKRVYAVRCGAGGSASPHVAERLLRQVSGDAFVIPHEGKLAVVVNETLADSAVYRARLSDALGRIGLAAGASPAFLDMGELAGQFQAALVAACVGPAGSVTDFEEVKLDYALSLVREGAVGDVRHRALSELAEYDAAHRSQLLETLRCFVRNRGSYVATYEELFIHRSTLSYRLERICAIAEIDLGDRRTWAHLAFSFLLDEQESSTRGN